jgi:hypothetical protein
MFNKLIEKVKGLSYENKSLFNMVLSAIDPETVITNGKIHQDTAFIVELSEAGADPQDQTMVHQQNITYTFAVLMAIRNPNDPLGKNAPAKLQKFKQITRDAIAGWSPDPATYTPITFIKAEPLIYLNGGVFWMETFTTDYIYRINYT